MAALPAATLTEHEDSFASVFGSTRGRPASPAEAETMSVFERPGREEIIDLLYVLALFPQAGERFRRRPCSTVEYVVLGYVSERPELCAVGFAFANKTSRYNSAVNTASNIVDRAYDPRYIVHLRS